MTPSTVSFCGLFLCVVLNTASADWGWLKEGENRHLPVRQTSDSPCDSGLILFETFLHCGRPSGSDRSGIYTKSGVIEYVHDYCQDWSSVLSCFNKAMSSCDRSLRREARQVAKLTTIVCQDGDVNPVLLYAINNTEENGWDSSTCDGDMTPAYQCFAEAQVAAGLPEMDSDILDVIDESTPTEIAGYVNGIFTYLVPCVAEVFYNQSQSCPNWRENSLMFLADVAIPAPIGLQMPFNLMQIDQIFKWDY